MEDTALAYSAWAGFHSARGQHGEAEKYAAWAKEAAGRVILGQIGGTDGLCVVSRGEPSVEDIDHLIATLGIIRNTFKRRAEREAERKAAAEAAAAAQRAAPPAGEGTGGP